MAINLKEYVRESVKEYLAIIKVKLATKAELNAKNATNVLLDGYSKPTTTGAIGTADAIQVAIGKLEKGLEDAGTSENDHAHSNKAILDAITVAFTTALKNKLDAIEAGANNYSLPTDVVQDSAYNNFSNSEKSKVGNLPSNANTTFATKTEVNDLNTLFLSDDTTLDELQEVVNYIKANRSDLGSLSLDNIAETATKIHFTPTMRNNLLFTDVTATEALSDWNNS